MSEQDDTLPRLSDIGDAPLAEHTFPLIHVDEDYVTEATMDVDQRSVGAALVAYGYHDVRVARQDGYLLLTSDDEDRLDQATDMLGEVLMEPGLLYREMSVTLGGESQEVVLELAHLETYVDDMNNTTMVARGELQPGEGWADVEVTITGPEHEAYAVVSAYFLTTLTLSARKYGVAEAIA